MQFAALGERGGDLNLSRPGWDSDSGSDSGLDLGLDLDSDLGSDLGSDLDSDLDSEGLGGGWDLKRTVGMLVRRLEVASNSQDLWL